MSDTVLHGAFALRKLHPERTSIPACIICGLITAVLLLARALQSRRVSPPCEVVVEQAECTNRRNGDENAGFLSKKAAFSPLMLPRKTLPPAYACWDETAAILPRLLQTRTLRTTLDHMPILDAYSEKQLPGKYLQRAATILGLLAHAYVRLEGTVSLTEKYVTHAEVLPKAICLPWTQVCKRLGRDNSPASLSYIDLVVYNYTTTQISCREITLENSKLLVPTVDNKEERTFYGTMIEINSKVIPIFHQVIEAQRSVLANDVPALKRSLQKLLPLLKEITRSINKISLKEASKSYVDPTVWTMTVANLAIPWLKGATGAAGTAHPFFHMMDVFTDRKNYDSKIGREAITVRSSYPAHWQQFLHALSQVSVQDFIDQLTHRDKKDLSTLWASLEREYAGNQGLLGIHRRKVYGYLSVAFRMGRNSTINGLGGESRRTPWAAADQEIEKSRLERQRADEPKANVSATPPRLEVFSLSDVIHHNTAAQGYWLIGGLDVYDATNFMNKHPGGRKTIALCSGQDATRDLAAVDHLSDPKIRAALERYRIGKLRRTVYASQGLQQLYDRTAWLAQKSAEAENICRETLSFLHAKTTALDEPNELTAFKLHHLHKTKAKLRDEHAPALFSQVNSILTQLRRAEVDWKASRTTFAPTLAAAVAGAEAAPPVDAVDLTSCDSAVSWFDQDLRWMGDIKALTATALKVFESAASDAIWLDDKRTEAVTETLRRVADRLKCMGSKTSL